MALEIWFTGLLFFALDDSAATVRIVKAAGHTPKIEVVTKGGSRFTEITADVTVTGMDAGLPAAENSFRVLIPSIRQLAGRASMGDLDEKKVQALTKLRLQGGTLRAAGGTRWCEFRSKSNKRKAGYGIVSSVVVWEGAWELIKIGGVTVDIRDAVRLVIHNDMDDPASSMNHFGAYYRLLKKPGSPKDDPIPCPDEPGVDIPGLEAVLGAGSRTAPTKASLEDVLRLLRIGNPLLCPPAQQ